MEPIATLPVFYRLAGKRVVLAGGTPPAVWKAELLAAAGADVVVLAAAPCPELVALAALPLSAGSIALVARDWDDTDLAGAAMAIGAIEEDGPAAAFRAAARRAGVPVNVIDRPAFCDFQFGTVVSRSPLVVGISTDGAAPVFGQAVRARIEAVLPQGLRRWAEAAQAWRTGLRGLDLPFRARRRFWEAFADRAFRKPEAAPDEADRAACLADALGTGPASVRGHLTLVCAGTGEPDDMTLRAIRALQQADVVLHGASVPAAVVDLARREATRQSLAPDAKGDLVPWLLSELMAAGRRVAWLDTGDPVRCLRWDERRAALSAEPAPERVGGLGKCEACRPGCPSWPEARP